VQLGTARSHEVDGVLDEGLQVDAEPLVPSDLRCSEKALGGRVGILGDGLVLLAREHLFEKLREGGVDKHLELAHKHLAIARCQHAGQPVHVGQSKHPLRLLRVLLRVLRV